MVYRQREASGIGEGLFDLDFEKFATPHIVKLAYVLTVVLAGLMSLVVLWRTLNAGAIGFVLGWVIAPLFFFAVLAYSRVVLEALSAVVGMGQNISEMASRTVTPVADRQTALEYLGEHGKSRVDEIADGPGIPEPDLRRVLTSLKNEGRIQEESLGTYGPVRTG